MRRVNESALITINAIEGGQFVAEKFENEMRERTKELCRLSKEQAEKLAEALEGELVALGNAEWSIVMKPLPYFHIYFALVSDGIKVLFDKKALEAGMPVDDAYDITRLVSNALVRKARKLFPE
ncbi:hypothetical protein [Candidatus Alkanophaga liquidiphilum]|nr:hypothetical protein [Candidatus Alkanophaga liquidiphilum]RLG38597.1 MAG: hypothetical protein DRN91_02235 [Candidatus Alkanophagales archaeon]